MLAQSLPQVPPFLRRQFLQLLEELLQRFPPFGPKRTPSLPTLA
jgi:hypothetical protein